MSSSVSQKQQGGVGGKVLNILKELFGWVNFWNILVLLALVTFICTVYPAHANEGSNIIMLEPKEGIDRFGVVVINPNKSNKKGANMQALIAGDLEVAGLKRMTESSFEPKECAVEIRSNGYLIGCFVQTKIGTCHFPPALVLRKDVVRLFDSFYRQCSEKGITTTKPWS
jgi:hypothetical protein